MVEMALGEIAYKMFSWHVRGKKYYSLQENLRKARMTTTADVYVATVLLTTVLTCVGGIVIGFLFSTLLHLELLFSIMVMLMLSVILGGLTYLLGISYPGIIAGERGRKVDAALPYTIGFMHAMSRSGASIVDIFRELSARPDVGELQGEAKAFMRDIEYLGRDPLTALRDLARTTPSAKFKSFLDVLISIIETGGDVTPYFSTKVIELQNVLKEENKTTIASLELMAELYVIMIAFLPLLFLAILIFIGFLPGHSVDVNLLRVLAYGWIPLGSIAFAVMLATTSPVRIGGRARPFVLPSPYKTVQLTTGDNRDTALLKQLRGTLWQMKLKRFLSNPFRVFLGSPSYILFFSGPIAVLYFLSTPTRTVTLFIAFMIAFVPYAIFYEFRSKRVSQIERALPDFLKSLSSASRSGLTLPRAIAITSSAELGPLTDEVRRARTDIQWGGSASEALGRMEQRVGVSDVAARTMTLIRKASEAEENISDVVDIALNDVQVRRSIMKERSSSMFVYMLILIITFAVFLITVYFIVSSYMALPTGELEIGGVKIGGADPLTVKTLFYHVLLLQGLSAGFIAGQMGSSDMKSGLKIAIGMGVMAVLMFELVLMPLAPKPPTPVEESFVALPLMT
ncbi:MAG: type II secretion system F family protein [Hadesarchaea archaeon]|nr:type II secretion system F family protein [Hadesarchaea archaeon]